jgi:uncharacterized protein DUF4922
MDMQMIEGEFDRTAAESPALMNLWWEKYNAGLVRNDPDLLILRPAEHAGKEFTWGTVFYSKAREDYKTRLIDLPSERAATFDVDLMAQLQIGRMGDLLIAANPNSIVPGHLVVYPAEKREDLSFADIRDMCQLAAEQTQWTFIHNMENAAASIVDWAHYQAYPWDFPMAQETTEAIFESSRLRLSRLPDSYPSYTLMASAENEEVLATWLFEMLCALKAGAPAGEGKRIPCNLPCNIVWRGRTAWLIPRSLSQTILAAKYIGALELGGLFCLPSADNLRQYLPEALRAEVRQAGISDQPELRDWCEQTAREVAVSLS